MSSSHYQEFLRVVKENQELLDILRQYWQQYSHAGTWQFWVLILGFIVPLIVLYIKIDRSKIFLIGFFGLNIHVWAAYLDTYGTRTGLWGYPYKLVTEITGNVILDTSLIPVAFMLVYQWTLINKKNFYLYALISCAIFAFILKPIMAYFDFFWMNENMNYFKLLLFYVADALISILITKIFIKMSRNHSGVY
jgi:hypothetical protein